MKKSELKNIIKECVKEVIFEEGVLSGIITEVAQGLNSGPAQDRNSPSRERSLSEQASLSKRRVLSAVGNSGYEEAKKRFNDPSLFEGTKPLPSGDGRGALAGVASGDSGLDISDLPGSQNWASVVNKIK